MNICSYVATVFVHNSYLTLIVCPFDEELRLRSDGTKALTDSRALGITGKGSRGELATRL